jgi:YD repeat-containing protein
VTLTGACCGVKQILLKPVLMETGVDWKFLVAGAAHEGTYFLESGDILCGTLSFNGTRTTYAYDSANQLTTVTTGAGSTTYGYDLVGNRTTSTMTLMNEVTDDGTFTHVYDNEGNETSKTNKATHDVWSFGYDNLNHMTTAIDKNSRGRR